MGGKHYDEDTKKQIVELRTQGMTYTQIADMLGIGWGVVQQTCSKNGVGACIKDSLYEQMREYKAQGHTMAEVGERFGVSQSVVLKQCKGISPQHNTSEKSANFLRSLNEELYGSIDERAIAFVEKYAPNMEYVSDYTGNKGHITVRCKACGDVKTRSCNAIRHSNNTVCLNCIRLRKEERERVIKQERLQQEQERERIRAEREAEREEERERKAQERWHDCPICGTRTNRAKYCSKECANSVINATKYARRRMKIESNMVDRNITLSSLFNRDGGVCHICGDQCRWDDYTTVDGQKIAGDWYPSIDHVVPISKGGQHSWKNVKLAHRWCNTIKRDIPLSDFLSGKWN